MTICRKSRCSSHDFLMRFARSAPIPLTSVSRAESESMIFRVSAPNFATIFFA